MNTAFMRLTWLLLVSCLSAVVLMTSASANDSTERTGDLVIFFKRAVSVPPDVETFTASQRLIESESISYYVGARAGSNYILQIVANSNALVNLSERQLITGRSGVGAYEFTQNAVNYGIGSNALTGGVGTLFTLTRQFLDMGIGTIEPESVKWEGNTFTAMDIYGRSQYGELEISNGLPLRLGISNAKGSPPYKMVEYTYPDPPTSLNGFPSKMAISGKSEGKLKPFGEVLFYSVQLATQPLSDNFFAAAQFAGPNIMHTNIYSNSDLYVGNSHGQMVKAPDSIRKSGGYVNSRGRELVILFSVLAIIVPVTCFFLLRKKTH